jgi:hypothetical protein
MLRRPLRRPSSISQDNIKMNLINNNVRIWGRWNLPRTVSSFEPSGSATRDLHYVAPSRFFSRRGRSGNFLFANRAVGVSHPLRSVCVAVCRSISVWLRRRAPAAAATVGSRHFVTARDRFRWPTRGNSQPSMEQTYSPCLVGPSVI